MSKEQQEKQQEHDIHELKRMLDRYFSEEDKRKEKDKKIDKIYEVLVGNNELKIKGLITEIEELREFKSQITKLKWYSLGGVGLLTLLYGVVKAFHDLMK